MNIIKWALHYSEGDLTGLVMSTCSNPAVYNLNVPYKTITEKMQETGPTV